MNWKKTGVCLMACALSLTLFGCELVTVDNDKDNAQAAIVVGDKTYSKEMVNGFINAQLVNAGVDKPAEKAYDEYRLEFGEQYAMELALSHYAAQNGYRDKLDEEDNKSVEEELAKATTTYETEIVEEAKEDLGFAGDDAKELDEAGQKRVDKRVEQERTAYLTSLGVSSLEDYKQLLIDQRAAEKYLENLRNGVSVSDEEIQTKYDSLTAEQKKSFDADAAAYMEAEDGAEPVVYNPAGFRRVKHVLIKIDEEASTKIKALEAEIAEMSDGQEKTNKQSELDIIKSDAYGKIDAKAKDIAKQAKNGANFDKLVTDNGEDEGMKTKTEGYLVHKDVTTQYDPAFQEGSMALAKVGDVSEPVQSAFGYHIIQYASDVENKTAELDTVKEDVSKALLEEKQQKTVTDKATSIYDGYKADGTVKVFLDRLKTATVPGK